MRSTARCPLQCGRVLKEAHCPLHPAVQQRTEGDPLLHVQRSPQHLPHPNIR